jgi:DNA-binding transcriptional ArsR family regulator
MSGLIEQIQDRTGTADERPRVLDVDDDDTDEVLDALSSDTGRALYRTLFDEPGTASEVANRCGTSVQNAHYHLSNLQTAGLIEPIETVYSEKGNEMTVYGPATDPLVLVGNRDLRSGIERSLTDVLAGLGLLGGRPGTPASDQPATGSSRPGRSHTAYPRAGLVALQ